MFGPDAASGIPLPEILTSDRVMAALKGPAGMREAIPAGDLVLSIPSDATTVARDAVGDRLEPEAPGSKAETTVRP